MKRLIATLSLLFVLLVPGVASADLTTGLVAYWKMDGNSTDATGNGRNGTDTSISYSTTHAILTQAAQFGGSSRIAVANNAAFNSTTGVTIAAWFYYAVNTGTQQIIVGKYDLGSNYIYMAIKGTNVVGCTVDSDTSDANGATTLVVGTLYFAACTFNGSQTTIYLNAVSDNTPVSTSAANPGAGGIGIGALGSNNIQFIANGSAIDEVGWWSRGLSSTEIAQLYNGGAGLQYPLTVAAAPTSIMGLVRAFFVF